METVNFKVLIIALKAWQIRNVHYIEPDKLLIDDIPIKIDGYFLKTNAWEYCFHNSVNELLNILWFEQLIKLSPDTKAKILFRYDLETLTKEKVLSTFDKKIY